MAANKTVIANMALRHLKISKEIQNLDTDLSAEAEAIRVFYDTLRIETLRAFYWGFATKFMTLSLIALKPTVEWDYSYAVPADCVRFRRILSCRRTDTRKSRVPFLIVSDPTGSIIYTDMISATCEYTYLNMTEQFYPSDFVLAFSFNIAQYVAASLTGGDPFKLGDRAAKMYEMMITEASSNAANESQPDEPPESEYILGRL